MIARRAEPHSRTPPRWLPALLNPVAKTVLRSPFHALLSRKLLLITFTGRLSGKVFTTPAVYERAGDIVRLRVGYPWWKNLRDGALVHVWLRGATYTATTQVAGEEGGLTVIEARIQHDIRAPETAPTGVEA